MVLCTQPKGGSMKRFALHAVALLTIAACQDQTVAPTAARPSFSTMPSVACPASPTFIVTDEASLRAALAAASPGAVIAIRGMVGIAADVFIETPNVTITCAAAGAGLFALSPSIDALILVDLGGSGAAIDGLVLDGSAVSVNGETFFAGDFFGPGLPVPNVRFSRNTVTCSPGGCTLLAGTSGAVISNNTFTSAGSFTGVHVRSEEHTSELQSPCNLVCRLLLEKKKKCRKK